MKQTTLCYLEHEGQYLMLHRVKKENDASHGKWIGVGGKCEADESPDECMLREVREETGLLVQDWRYRGIVTFLSNQQETEYMHLFTSDAFEGSLTECDEGTLEWIPWKKMLDLPHWEGDLFFLRLLETETPFFSLKLRYEGDQLTEAVLNGREKLR